MSVSSVSTVNSYSRFNDSVEREMLQVTSNTNQAYSALNGLAIVATAIGRGATAFGRYLVQVAEALNEARARDARFSGSQW